MKGEKPTLGKSNENELVFEKTGASLYIGTAGSKQFGRSDTITHLHCSEVAFWKDPKSLLKGLFQAVPHDTGVIIKECTANGYGTYHHKHYLRAKAGLSRFKAWFFPWFMFLEYTSQSPLASPLTEDEVVIQKTFNLTNGQLQWRREKIEELDGDEALFKQEYPATESEAFLLSGGSLFPAIECISTPSFKHYTPIIGAGKLRILDGHPNPFLHYTIGVDTGAGVGGDYSVAEVFCVESGEEVCTYAANTVPPPTFAVMVSWLGDKFSTEGTPAYMVPERNSHGITIVAILKDTLPYKDQPMRMFRDPGRKGSVTTGLVPLSGFVTGGISKYRLIGILQNSITTFTFHDEQTVEEIRGFSETALGTMTNKNAEHDDRVIASALASIGILRERRMGVVALVEPTVKSKILICPPFKVTFEEIMESLKAQRQTGYFKPQHIIN